MFGAVPFTTFVHVVDAIGLRLMAFKTVSSVYLIRYGISRIDAHQGDDPEKRKAAAAAVMQRIDRREQERSQGDAIDGVESHVRPRKEDLVLNQYEQMIAAEVVAPEDIAVGFEGQPSAPSPANTGLMGRQILVA